METFTYFPSGRMPRKTIDGIVHAGFSPFVRLNADLKHMIISVFLHQHQYKERQCQPSKWLQAMAIVPCLPKYEWLNLLRLSPE